LAQDDDKRDQEIRERIGRLSLRLKQSREEATTAEVRKLIGILQGILDLLADEL
jgi:hypothetical protein